MTDLHDHLLDFVLGHLHTRSPERAAAIEKGLTGDPALRAEHDMLVEALAGVALMAEPAEPSAVDALKGRVLRDAEGPQWFAPMLERFAALFDVATSKASEYLESIAQPGTMKPLMPGITFCDFEGGPATAGQTVGLVRIEPGGVFPNHRHLGTERVLILSGRARDSDGTVYRAGDLVESHEGSSHDTSNPGDEPLVYAVVAQGIKIEP